MQNRAVIFDLEGVLLHIDYQKTFSQFAEHGITVNYDGHFKKLAETYDKGQITTAEVFEQFQALYDQEKSLSYLEFVKAWNAMLIHIPDENLDYLFHLKQQGYYIILLSNINELHAQNVELTYGSILKKLVDKTIYSYEERTLKPDLDSFEPVFSFLASKNIDKTNTVFIDDTSINIAAAKQLNMPVIKYPVNGHAYTKQPRVSLRSCLDNYVPLFFNNLRNVIQHHEEELKIKHRI